MFSFSLSVLWLKCSFHSQRHLPINKDYLNCRLLTNNNHIKSQSIPVHILNVFRNVSIIIYKWLFVKDYGKKVKYVVISVKKRFIVHTEQSISLEKEFFICYYKEDNLLTYYSICKVMNNLLITMLITFIILYLFFIGLKNQIGFYINKCYFSKLCLNLSYFFVLIYILLIVLISYC